jgi:SAM-dependent methyltransferase
MTIDSHYYDRHVDILEDLFGCPVQVRAGELVTPSVTYPIVEDVIVLLAPEEYPVYLAARQGLRRSESDTIERQIQDSFSDEWRQYSAILPEHAEEFDNYFDLIDLATLRESRVCDLGCGIGRWSSFLAPHCRELILVDFSDAVFVARRNLRGCERALFFLGDIMKLPFRDDFSDFTFCLGVLHHLGTPALSAVSSIGRYAPLLLVYLYYALDNRPRYFRLLLALVSAVRGALSRVKSPRVRWGVAALVAALVYEPLVALGHVFDRRGYGAKVPLFETYQRKSLHRIQQDAYDRMFTPVEQRVTRREIREQLKGRFNSITVSERPPYWHFLCRRWS